MPYSADEFTGNLSERDVARQISDFLKWRGWRRLRTSSGITTNQAGNTFRFGEKGMPDFLFIRYYPKILPKALVLWVETKRPRGGKRSPDQIAWHEREAALGALVITAYDFESFEVWYAQTLSWTDTESFELPGNLHLDFEKEP